MPSLSFSFNASANLGGELNSKEKIKTRVLGLFQAYKMRGQAPSVALRSAISIVNKELPEQNRLSAQKGKILVGSSDLIICPLEFVDDPCDDFSAIIYMKPIPIGEDDGPMGGDDTRSIGEDDGPM